MEKFTIYHNPRYSKSRHALEYLQNLDANIEVIEYLKNVPSEMELTEILEKLNISPQMLLRKGEPIFKEEFKGRNLSDSEWVSAMVKYPKLIERPIIVKGMVAVIGRPLERIEELM